MFSDFYEAYHWLEAHPIFKNSEWRDSEFHAGLDVMVVKVDPKTERVEQVKGKGRFRAPDASRNTATRVWLEHGPYFVDEEAGWKGCSHDIDIDCGGNTFEEAIIDLANLVEKKYGDYDAESEEKKDSEWQWKKIEERKKK